MISKPQELSLKSNYNEISLKTGKPIYAYELEIENSTPELIQAALRQLRTQILEMLKNYMSNDNKIYSPKIVEEIQKVKPKIIGILQNNEEVQQIVQIYLIVCLNENDICNNQIIARLIKQVVKNQLQMVSVGKAGSKLFWSQRAAKQQENILEIWPGVECIINQVLFKIVNLNQQLILHLEFLDIEVFCCCIVKLLYFMGYLFLLNSITVESPTKKQIQTSLQQKPQQKEKDIKMKKKFCQYLNFVNRLNEKQFQCNEKDISNNKTIWRSQNEDSIRFYLITLEYKNNQQKGQYIKKC